MRPKVPGKMHACGHDGTPRCCSVRHNTYQKIGILMELLFLFFNQQRKGGGGGREMVNDGMLDRWNIQEVYGLHNTPGLPVGEFAIRSGSIMASADEFEITVTGKGGHAAAPHDSIDPNVTAAHIILALQSIASRNVDPLEQQLFLCVRCIQI